jgi:uncharacterized surface protein with fasciclin (FAS1) repeats
MKKKWSGFLKTLKGWVICAAVSLLALSSCTSDYNLDDILPEWLGPNIYDYLEKDGHYTTYIRLINDLKYDEVFRRTGSKTLFVATDSAFTEFYKQNDWHVKKYEDFTIAQKKLLLNFSIINNAYLIETLSNYYANSIYYEGLAMRRRTTLSPIDSIPFEQGTTLSVGKYFNSRRDKGIYLLKDNTMAPTVYFTQKFLNKNVITNEDMDYISGNIFSGNPSRVKDDVHVFDAKVVQRDIVCKNGYVHVLSKVLLPHTNLANQIEKNSNTTIFSKLLERFAVPLYDSENTSLYKQLNNSFNDSIFVKRYLATNGGTRVLPGGTLATNLLPFDPGWNSYQSSALPADMACMFVPTDDAMNNYFNNGVGQLLKNRFGTWDNVPDEIIVPFLKRHMRASLIESVPSRFSKMVDTENYRLPVEKSHIVGTYTAVNGQIFYTNEVYPPVDYISVYSPVLLSENAKIMNWAIKIAETSAIDQTKFEFYKLYLNSLVSTYSLFIPTDEFFENFLDPITFGQDVPAVLKFVYYEKTNSVTARIYKYDKVNQVAIGDPVDSISSSTSYDFIKNRLWSILDSHIVIGNITSDKEYYVTKANDIIRVQGTEPDMTVQGGNNQANGTEVKVQKFFNQQNGKTYFINHAIQPSLRSVYTTLSSTPEFSEFFELLSNVPEDFVPQIFGLNGIDRIVKFFNAYRYTIYVPTNDAITNAISSGTIKSWEQINALSGTAKTEATQKMVRFLRYHFQDNAVFFGHSVNGQFQTATLKVDSKATYWKTVQNKYYKIGVTGNAGSLVLRTEMNKTASVTGLHNIIAKDYIFSGLPTTYKNVDGTGATTGTAYNKSTIENSASAVIHQISDILTCEE